jgi:DNA-binding PucR family transcriptional regulator
MRAAIATAAVGVAGLADMRKEVDDILRAITQQSDLPAIAKLVDVHSQVLLSHVSDELERHPRLRHPGVMAMVAHDSDHKTDYASSVAAWLDAVGDIAAASERLHVHPNTLRYRLRRMGELFGITLDDPNERLSVWLQLRTQQWNRRPMAATPSDATTAIVG